MAAQSHCIDLDLDESGDDAPLKADSIETVKTESPSKSDEADAKNCMPPHWMAEIAGVSETDDVDNDAEKI